MLSRIHHELLVFSDIHLLSQDDERGKLLLELLSKIDTKQVRYLILLGDIFDFCFGGSQYFKERFASFGKELTRLSKEGVRVFFLEGNHEFLVHLLGWEGVEFVKSKNLKIKIPNGPSFAFTHGDYLEAPWHYRLYSELIRSKLSKILASSVPQNFLNTLALKVSAQSRKKSYSKRIEHKKIIKKISKWLTEQDTDFGIVGHFHIPYNVKVEKKPSQFFGLDSWDKPNCLAYDKGHFYRIYYKDYKESISPLI